METMQNHFNEMVSAADSVQAAVYTDDKFIFVSFGGESHEFKTIADARRYIKRLSHPAPTR